MLPNRSSGSSTPLAENNIQVEGSPKFVSRRSVSASSGSSSFERSVVLKEKRRAESVSSDSTDRSSGHEWSKGTSSIVGNRHVPKTFQDDSSGPNACATPFASDPRHYRLRVKKRRRRRKNDRPGDKTIFGPFKLPEDPTVPTGFKEPRPQEASGTPPSPETPVYLCKDGFDGTECVPGGKSVFIPKTRHRDIAGLGALSFREAALRPSRKVASPMSLKSHLPATSRSSEDEVGLFGGGSGSQVEPGRARPGPVVPGNATEPQEIQDADGIVAAVPECGLFAQLDGMEREARGRVIHQTPDVRGCSPHTPTCDESAPIPETPTRDRSFNIFSPFVMTRSSDGVFIETLGSTKAWAAHPFPRRKTTSGERTCLSQRGTDSVFVPKEVVKEGSECGMPGSAGM